MNFRPRMQQFSAVWLFVCVFVVAAANVSAEPVPWERASVPSKHAVNSVMLACASAGKRLVAVGERGHVLISDDNAVTWRQVTVPVSSTLVAVHFVTPAIGWIAGHNCVILKTVDGGETWAKQLDGTQAAQLVLEASRGKDSADSAQRFVDDGPDKPFFDLYFENETSGYVVGAYGLIFHTADGGQSWESWRDNLDNPRELHLYKMQHIGKDIYIAGEQGLFLKSDDKGKTFKSIKSPYQGSFFGMVGSQQDDIIIFGLRGNAFRSSNGGVSWQTINTGSTNTITAGLQLSDGKIILVSRSGEVLQSHDNGLTFQKISMNKSFPFTNILQIQNGNMLLIGHQGFMFAAY